MNDLLKQANKIKKNIIDYRRKIHQYPEVGLQLPKTQKLILNALAGLNMKVIKGKKITSVKAVLKGKKPGKTILLRADMDALPLNEKTNLPFKSKIANAMHACGHDSHVAMLLGSAKILANYRDVMAGNIVFMFQPGEEGLGGAQTMIDEGVLTNPKVDAAFAIHISPLNAASINIKDGTLLASCDSIDILVTGKGGHGAMPHQVINSITILGHIYHQLRISISELIDPLEPAVLSFGHIQSGHTHNVIPDKGLLQGTLRTVSEKTRKKMHAFINKTCLHIAKQYGADIEVVFNKSVPCTVNNKKIVDVVEKSAISIIGTKKFDRQLIPLMASEDFSLIINKVPGAMAMLGACPKGVNPLNAAPFHSSEMMIDDSVLPIGTALHCQVALNYLGYKK